MLSQLIILFCCLGMISSTFAIELDGVHLMLWNCTENYDERQLFFPLATDATIRVVGNTSMCVGIEYGLYAGALVSSALCHTSDKNPKHQNQEWYQEAANPHRYKAAMVQWCLTTATPTFAAPIMVGDCTSFNSQWETVSSGNGTSVRYRLVSTNYCLNIGASVAGNPCASPPFSKYPFCNTNLSIDSRVTDVISRLTLTEKVGLLGSSASLAPNAGIGLYQWWSEGLHGVGYSPAVMYGGSIPSASSFPQVSLTAATFDPVMFHEIGRAIGIEARAMNNQQRAGLTFWAPNLNIYRDPRWGRGQETPGEDPFLTSLYVKTFVNAFQTHPSDPTRLLVSSCCKHFAAYSLEDYEGMDRHHFNAIVTQQDLADTYLPAFEACIHPNAGGASGIMCSYNAVNGIPSCAHYDFMTTLARNTWGFDGYIVSDCGATDDVQYNHNYTNATGDTCRATLTSGMDLDCGGFLQTYTQKAVEKNHLNESAVDAALSHLFRVQFRLGMFDPSNEQPFLKIPPSVVNSKKHQDLALRVAEEGIVLLKNSHTTQALPWSRTSIKRIAIIGPNAHDALTLQGNYAGRAPYLRTPYDGLRDFLGAENVTYAKGCEVTDKTTSGFAAACSAATFGDAVVLVVGSNQTVESEGIDRISLKLPGEQVKLVDRVVQCAQGRPVVVVVMAGGSFDISPIVDNGGVATIMWVGFPGQSGGDAIARTLFGLSVPSGRLPFTIYQSDYVNQISMFDMNMRPNVTTGSPGRTYRFYTGTPVFSFGFGLSYTTFSYYPSTDQSLSLVVNSTSQLKPYLLAAGETDLPVIATVSFTIENTGNNFDAKTSLLVYAESPNSGVDGRPRKSLVGIAKRWVGRGRPVTVTVNITVSAITHYDFEGKRTVEHGMWKIFANDNSTKAVFVNVTA